MVVYNSQQFTRGWFVGNFAPTAYQTKDFEVAVLSHKAGEIWPKHYHEQCSEINWLLHGRMTIQGIELQSGDVFVLAPGEIADPIFHEDCQLVVVKTASNPYDKVVIP